MFSGAPNNWNIHSFTMVLPLEPVMANTGPSKDFLQALAHCCSTSIGLLCSIKLMPGCCAAQGSDSLHTTAMAPREMACSMYWWPSFDAVVRAIKHVGTDAFIRRESKAKCRNVL